MRKKDGRRPSNGVGEQQRMGHVRHRHVDVGSDVPEQFEMTTMTRVGVENCRHDRPLGHASWIGISPSDSSTDRRRRTRRRTTLSSTLLCSLLAVSPWTAMAQNCVSLAGSTACPAFRSASIATNAGLSSSFPFLSFVSDARSFDDQLLKYISTDYARSKYGQILGCDNLNLADTSSLYARYTTSVICNAIVQNSRGPCRLAEQDARPLCADSCAQHAISEQQVVANRQLCTNPSANAVDQIRADFTVCSLPADSLSGDCLPAALNEPTNCGYGNNRIGLCSHCARSSPNSTDTCCYTANVASRCEGIQLPTMSALPPLFPTATGTTTGTPSASNTAGATAEPVESGGLTGGQVAGVVAGVVVGLALVIGLLVFFWLSRRRRRGSLASNVFNQPSPPRMAHPPVMAFQPVAPPALAATSPQQPGYEVLPGGRIARMSALEGPSDSSSPSGAGTSGRSKSRHHQPHQFSSSSEYGESPESRMGPDRVPLHAPPPLGRRAGSLSSASGHARDGTYSSPPTASAGEHSSPPGLASQQSEQLTSFKDYYSTDEIHPGDRVSTLWAYQPRAPDEFELERGDMIRVVGIWDDGWATGVRLSSRAEDWDGRSRKRQRESDISSSSDSPPSPPTPSKIKAFPLVCVCLPQHWRKTVEADGSPETDSTGAQRGTG